MRFLSLLSLIPLVAAFAVIPREQQHQNPRQRYRLTHPKPNVHLNFPLPDKSVLKPYRPSQKEFADVKQKIQSEAKAKSKTKAKTPTANAADPLMGVLAAFVQPYGFVGYVSSELTSFFHTTPLNTDLAKAAFVTLPAATPGPNFEFALYNGSAPFLGDIEGYSGPNWGVGLPGYGTMTHTQSSSWPATDRNNPTGLPSESKFWKLNVSTSEVTGVWFNDDGTEVQCTIFYDATYGDVNFTGDLPAYLQVYPDQCYVTTLYFVPLSYFGL